jgi:hypothetical protein
MRILVSAVLSLPATAALAGMPNVTLSDAASLRLSGISFFLFLLLLAAWGFKGLWNFVRRDFPRMPLLSYRRALAFVLLLGLLLNVVLLMIAGTRELMTPGAWQKSGISYKLRDSSAPGTQR